MNFIDRLNNAIDVEYDSKNAEVDELMLLPVEERVLKGDAVADVTVNFIPMLTSNGKIYFERAMVSCKQNISKFREGSPVLLVGHGYTFSLNIAEDNDEAMLLEVGWQNSSVPEALNNKSGWRLETDKVDIRNIVKKSTSILQNDLLKNKLLSGMFDGSIVPQLSAQMLSRGAQLAKETNLNPTQQQAFANAYATENYFLIQGPPGTGKTLLLAHLALQFAKEGKKVLITAFTHTAINNALQKARAISGFSNIFKVGKKSDAKNLNIEGAKVQNITDFRNSGFDNNSRGLIVGATCYAPFTNKLEFMDWDVVIIDEAGQMSIALAIAAMVKGKKYILIGDHKQLPPIISDKQKDLIFRKSIFEHLFQFSAGIMLNTTYRMNAAINAFPSKQFYNGRLLPDKSNENQLLEIDNHFTLNELILDVTKPEVLICHNQTGFDTRSEFEAALIAKIVAQYLRKGVSAKEIAIITPFRAQVRQINKALAKLLNDALIKQDLFVDTVERIQGQERDVVIFSLSISDPFKVKQRTDFFFNPNRLNVALTRSKKKRIVIAHKALFEFKTNDPDLLPLVKNFTDFYDASTKIMEYEL